MRMRGYLEKLLMFSIWLLCFEEILLSDRFNTANENLINAGANEFSNISGYFSEKHIVSRNYVLNLGFCIDVFSLVLRFQRWCFANELLLTASILLTIS